MNEEDRLLPFLRGVEADTVAAEEVRRAEQGDYVALRVAEEAIESGRQSDLLGEYVVAFFKILVSSQGRWSLFD
jgi:hypothetical protein